MSKIAHHSRKLPPSELDEKLVDFDGQKRTCHDDHEIFRPMRLRRYNPMHFTSE